MRHQPLSYEDSVTVAKRYHCNPDSYKSIASEFKISIKRVGNIWEKWYLEEIFPNSEAGKSLQKQLKK